MPSVFGPVGWEELTDGVLVAAQPCGAPSWFPCNDRPDDKASYRFAITVADGYRVVANGVLAGRERRSGRTTWRYVQAQPMAPYLAVLHIGRYVSTAAGEVEVLHPRTVPVGVGTAFERQADMLEVFTGLFGPYPFDGYAVVITADDLEIPLEAQTLSTFGANHAVAGWNNERLVAHELAHQWFGNSLTAATWADIWLHEGFACYSEWLWSEASGGEAPTNWRASITASWPRCRRTCCSAIRAATTCSTTGCTSGGRSPCTRCGLCWVTGSSTCCVTGRPRTGGAWSRLRRSSTSPSGTQRATWRA